MSSQSKAGWLELFYDLIFAACTLIIFMAMKQDFAVENQWWLSFVVLLLFSLPSDAPRETIPVYGW